MAAYPESLVALWLDNVMTAGYLAALPTVLPTALPTDPCTDGEPFRYRLREMDGELREGNGKRGYLLYGIGFNMRDDNGTEGTQVDPETGEEHRGDDVVIAMPYRVTG